MTRVLAAAARWMVFGLLSLLMLAGAAWAVLALQHRAAWPLPWAGFVIVATLIALWLLWRRDAGLAGWPAGLGLFVISLAAVLVWWRGIEPSADRTWAVQLSRLPQMSISGDMLTVRNVRTFRWEATPGTSPPAVTERPAEIRWEDRSYRLSQATGVDLFFSYWSGPWIAHLVVSVTFADQPPLAFSIEIRREQGESYSPIAGFFKEYELAIVAADETDVIRLRTDVWQEDVRLYRLNVTPEQARTLLRAYAAEINALQGAASWYHTVFANCTTVAFRLARQVWPSLGLDWRVLAAGYVPDYAYDLKAVATTLPLQELKDRAAISQRARALPAGVDFSAAIREGVPKP